MLWANIQLILVVFTGFAYANNDYFFDACNSFIQDNNAYADIVALDAQLMMGDTKSRTWPVLCSNVDYARSLADCIVSMSNLTEGVSPRSKMWSASWGYFDYTCEYEHTKNIFTWDEIYQMNYNSPINVTYNQANQTGSLLMHMPNDLLEPLVIPSLDWHWSRISPIIFGQAQLYYVFGIFFIQICGNFVAWVYPGLRRTLSQSAAGRLLRSYFSIPPLFSSQVSHWVNFFGPRLQLVYITGFIVLEIVLVSVDFPVHLGIFGKKSTLIGNNLAYRSGYMAVYKLPLVFLFGIRNNFLIWLTGWNQDVFNIWHRWVARILAMNVIIHAAAYTIHYGADVPMAWTDAYWIWGFVSLMCMNLMWFFGMSFIRNRWYEIFLISHIVLAVFALIGLQNHLWYTNQCKELWYTVVAIWGFDRIVRIIRVVWNGNIQVATAWIPTGDALILEVPFSGSWKPSPGNHVYVYFLSPLTFWQSHPFTVLPGSKPDMIKLVFKPRRGLTRKIYNQILERGGTGELNVLVEGPYGISLNLEPYDSLEFIAGGVGITGVYSHLHALHLETAGGHRKSVRVDWMIRDKKPLLYFEKELKTLLDRHVEVVIHVTGNSSSLSTDTDVIEKTHDVEETESKIGLLENEAGYEHLLTVLPGRPHVEEIIFNSILNSGSSLCIYTCGPQGLVRDARDATSEALLLTKKYIQFYDECFAI